MTDKKAQTRSDIRHLCVRQANEMKKLQAENEKLKKINKALIQQLKRVWINAQNESLGKFMKELTKRVNKND